MKKLIQLLAVPVVTLCMTACGGNGSAGSDASDEYQITEFEIGETLMTADKNYRVETGYGTVYLDLYTSIHWPERFGGNDLTVLRDSMLRYAYGDTTETDVRKAIRTFLADTSVVEGAESVTPVDSMPSDSMTYFNSVTASVMELDEEMVTYQVVSSTYLGGAHPMTGTRPFTYVFADSKVLSTDNMFLPGVGTDSIMPIIKDALARQMSVPVSGLEQAGIFVSQLTYPGRPYIASNTLYFHYDPYEIGPYALGPVDVAVYPNEVDRFLRPDVKSLFDQGY